MCCFLPFLKYINFHVYITKWLIDSALCVKRFPNYLWGKKLIISDKIYIKKLINSAVLLSLHLLLFKFLNFKQTSLTLSIIRT